MMGDGAITSLSRKLGMNTRSSTEAKVVATDEIISPMIWTQLFLKVQGYPIKREYPLSRQQKHHVDGDQQMQECWQALLSSEHPILLCC